MADYRPNLQGGASFWQDGCSTVYTPSALSGFAVDDHAPTEHFLYPLLPHASSPSTDVVNWRLGRSGGVSLAGNMRVSLGICLDAPEPDEDLGSMYEYAIAFYADSADASVFIVNPFFGQLANDNATPVENKGQLSGSTKRNKSCFTALPAYHGEFGLVINAHGTVLVKQGISTIDPVADSIGNPIVVGVIITNVSASSRSITYMDCHISGMKYDAPIPAYAPHPYS